MIKFDNSVTRLTGTKYHYDGVDYYIDTIFKIWAFKWDDDSELEDTPLYTLGTVAFTPDIVAMTDKLHEKYPDTEGLYFTYAGSASVIPDAGDIDINYIFITSMD